MLLRKMDKVYNDYESLIISRKNSENVVLLSIHEYNSLIETDYLFRNEANAAHLKKSTTPTQSVAEDGGY